MALLASEVGALAIALGGILALSAGLVVIAAVVGLIVGWVLRGPASQGRSMAVAAVGIALLGVATGQLWLWVIALLEGGVLGPLDYLAQTFGFLVPAQFIVAGLGAWLGAAPKTATPRP
jgi:hypothetical protein